MALLLVISEFMSRPVLGQKPTCGQRHATHRRILPSAEREYHDHRLHQPDFSDWLTMPPAMPARRLWARRIRPRPPVLLLPPVRPEARRVGKECDSTWKSGGAQC